MHILTPTDHFKLICITVIISYCNYKSPPVIISLPSPHFNFPLSKKPDHNSKRCWI